MAPHAAPPSVASKSRSEKSRYPKRARRSREAVAEKGGRLVSDRLRASVNYARKQKRKAASGIVESSHEGVNTISELDKDDKVTS